MNGVLHAKLIVLLLEPILKLITFIGSIKVQEICFVQI